MATAPSPYLRHRFPPAITAQCVRISMRFLLSFRAVDEAMLLRGVQVSYETIRRWRRTFGQQFANKLHRRRPRPGDTWHLDEAFGEDQRADLRPVASGGRGERWTKRGMCLMCWCKAGVTR